MVLATWECDKTRFHGGEIRISWFKVDIGPKNCMQPPFLSPILILTSPKNQTFYALYVCITYESHVLYVCIMAKGSRTGAVLEHFRVSDYDVSIDRPFRASLTSFHLPSLEHRSNPNPRTRLNSVAHNMSRKLQKS